MAHDYEAGPYRTIRTVDDALAHIYEHLDAMGETDPAFRQAMIDQALITGDYDDLPGGWEAADAAAKRIFGDRETASETIDPDQAHLDDLFETDASDNNGETTAVAPEEPVLTVAEMGDLFEVPLPEGTWKQDVLPTEDDMPVDPVAAVEQAVQRVRGASPRVNGQYGHQPHYIQAFTSPEQYGLS